jgi:hypothetical protein
MLGVAIMSNTGGAPLKEMLDTLGLVFATVSTLCL